MTKEKTCPKCGCTSRYEGNFCVYCGNKIEPMCHPCWVLGKDYDCQSNKCRYAEIKKAGEGVEGMLFGIEYDPETKTVKIFSLNDEGSIVLQGKDEVERFTDRLKNLFR